jgi:hypothetical protein
MRTEKEILATAKAYRNKGMLPPPLSNEEKARAFGDPSLSGGNIYQDKEIQWAHAAIQRLKEGLWISKSDKKRLKSIIKTGLIK